ncbi:MAG: acetate/propionate family kinase [Patescibacteria group bacterium]
MTSHILVLNAGSATLKFELFQNPRKLASVVAGSIERIGLRGSFACVRGGKPVRVAVRTHSQALHEALKMLPVPADNIGAVGHRVVHGGERYAKPVAVTSAVLRHLERYSKLAPLHNPVNISVIRASMKLMRRQRHVAVFDTSFFSGIAPEHYLYAIPYRYYLTLGIRRYGFHGISHGYATRCAAKRLGKKLSTANLITLHLGNGCSAAAIRNGKPVTTSMGYTPLEGLVMGTRSGSIDPAVPLVLQQALKKTPAQIDHLLNAESGLLGLSGFTSDMREILRAAGQPVSGYHGRAHFAVGQRTRARLALHAFIVRLQHYIAAYAGLLGTVDAVVFTGGIGERSAAVRRLAMGGLSLPGKPRVVIIPAREELAIAQQVARSVY